MKEINKNIEQAIINAGNMLIDKASDISNDLEGCKSLDIKIEVEASSFIVLKINKEFFVLPNYMKK